MARLLTWLLRTPIAHRGLHDTRRGVIENSLPAFWAASRAGFPAELDARLLADGEVVVFHDQHLERLTEASGPIAALTSAQLRNVLLAGAGADGDPKTEDARIPLLKDVLDLVAGSTPLLIEVKNEATVGPIERAVMRALADYRGPFAIQSFNPGTVRFWRDHAPEVPRGLLSGDFRHEQIDDGLRRRLQNLEDVAECEPDFIGYDVRLLPFPPVARERTAGRLILGWTVRSPEEGLRALAHCDNVIFEGFDPVGLRGGK
jgi:glycerophosphoryl diester phosphodiesterase